MASNYHVRCSFVETYTVILVIVVYYVYINSLETHLCMSNTLVERSHIVCVCRTRTHAQAHTRDNQSPLCRKHHVPQSLTLVQQIVIVTYEPLLTAVRAYRRHTAQRLAEEVEQWRALDRVEALELTRRPRVRSLPTNTTKHRH